MKTYIIYGKANSEYVSGKAKFSVLEGTRLD